MRIGISNLAWDAAEDAEVARLLLRHGIDAIDVAPGKYFPQPARARDAEIADVRRWWAAHGIEITGMQALLFGTQGLNVFGAAQVQGAMLDHLTAVCRIGAGLGATRLVFGSPKNRDRGSLDDEAAAAIASAFFGRVGEIARSFGVTICLEPNPACYGGNFMTHNAETARIVRRIDHPAVRMQFDTGALAINGESPDVVLVDCAALIGHVHVSEPQLVPLGDGATDHRAAALALQAHGLGDDALVTIEMLATIAEPHLGAIERALLVAKSAYQGAPTAAAP